MVGEKPAPAWIPGVIDPLALMVAGVRPKLRIRSRSASTISMSIMISALARSNFPHELFRCRHFRRSIPNDDGVGVGIVHNPLQTQHLLEGRGNGGAVGGRQGVGKVNRLQNFFVVVPPIVGVVSGMTRIVLGVTAFQNDLLCIATSFKASSILMPLRSSLSGAGRKSGVKATFSPASLPRVSKTLRLSAERAKVGKRFLGKGCSFTAAGWFSSSRAFKAFWMCLGMCLFCLRLFGQNGVEFLSRSLIGRINARSLLEFSRRFIQSAFL